MTNASPEPSQAAIADARRRQQRLAMHQAAVCVLIAKPDRLTRVLDALARWSESARIDSSKLQEWGRLVAGRQWEVFLEDSEAGDDLRKGSPLPFALDVDERAATLAQYAR